MISNKFVGLIHQTSFKNLESIVKSGELYTNVKLWYKNIKDIEGFTVGNFSPSAYGGDSYPGVYMGLITENDLYKKIKYIMPITLVFCRTLLARSDFIYNKDDSNGFSNKDLTITSLKDLNSYIDKDNHDLGNEVVFHNPVPLKYLKEIWIEEDNLQTKIVNLLYENNLIIPIKIMNRFSKTGDCDHVPVPVDQKQCYFFDKYKRYYRDVHKPAGYPYDIEYYRGLMTNCDVKKETIDNISSPDDFEKILEKPLIDTSIKEEIKEFLLANKVSKKFIDNLTDEQILDMTTINTVGLNFVKSLSKYEYPDGNKRRSIRKPKRRSKRRSKSRM